MIAIATARNADHVARGAASFATGDLTTAELGDRCFDEVFAIRVSVFLRGQPADELRSPGRRADCAAAVSVTAMETAWRLWGGAR